VAPPCGGVYTYGMGEAKSVEAIVQEFRERNPGIPVELEHESLSCRLSLSGALGMQASYKLQALLLEVIDAIPEGTLVVVDLAHVDYISSTGVGALSSALVRAHRRAVPFMLAHLQPKVRGVFQILGLIGYFREAPEPGPAV